MAPHLVRWHKKYSDDGLQVIEVFGNSADRKCGKGGDAVKKHLDDYEVPYAVLSAEPAWIEKTYGVWAAGSVAYLVGRDGKVTWQYLTRGHEDTVEAEIRDALGLVLRKAGSK